MDKSLIVGYLIGVVLVIGLSWWKYHTCETTENETMQYICWLTED